MKKTFKCKVTYCDVEKVIDYLEIEPMIVGDKDEVLLQIDNKAYDPTKGDKFYFLPGVSIPRVKLKDLSINFGIKSTRKLEDATHVFAGKSTMNKISDRTWCYKVSVEVFQKVYEIMSNDKDVDDYYCEKLKVALENNESDSVYMNYETAAIFRNTEGDIFNEIREEFKIKSVLRNSTYCTTLNQDFVEELTVIENNNIPILDESELLKHINGDDATIIDDNTFNQLSAMFMSHDEDNTVLAMEIMANCNYTESLLYLEMLFKENSYRMEKSRTKNHVNFKGLLAFLNKDKSYMSTDLDEIVKSLRDNNVLNTESLNIILNKYNEEILAHGGTDVFEVKTITVNKEITEELNCNYKFTCKDDYIKEEEDVVEIHGNLEEMQESTITEDVEEELKTNTQEEPVEIKINEDGEGQSTKNDFNWF